jgi:hypothetical protein
MIPARKNPSRVSPIIRSKACRIHLEAAIVRSLAPASYTAILQGAGGGTGVGVVEVYALQ